MQPSAYLHGSPISDFRRDAGADLRPPDARLAMQRGDMLSAGRTTPLRVVSVFIGDVDEDRPFGLYNPDPLAGAPE